MEHVVPNGFESKHSYFIYLRRIYANGVAKIYLWQSNNPSIALWLENQIQINE